MRARHWTDSRDKEEAGGCPNPSVCNSSLSVLLERFQASYRSPQGCNFASSSRQIDVVGKRQFRYSAGLQLEVLGQIYDIRTVHERLSLTSAILASVGSVGSIMG